MTRQIGSQYRETLEEAGYWIVDNSSDETILADEDGKLEVWVENNHYAGWVLEINGIGYEFVRSV
jgi:hypothetical protein